MRSWILIISFFQIRPPLVQLHWHSLISTWWGWKSRLFTWSLSTWRTGGTPHDCWETEGFQASHKASTDTPLAKRGKSISLLIQTWPDLTDFDSVCVFVCVCSSHYPWVVVKVMTKIFWQQWVGRVPPYCQIRVKVQALNIVYWYHGVSGFIITER